MEGGDSMTKTNLGLVEFAKSKLGTPYVYGAKGQMLTQAEYNRLKKAYGNFVWDSDSNKIGKVCVDCSGLISWYTAIVKGSSQFKTESEAQPISTIAKAPIGAAVWFKGHIGIYIGNGEVIEAKGSSFGVVQTKVSQGSWTHWFKLMDVEYIIEEAAEMIEKIKIIVDDKEQYVDGIRKDDYVYVKIRDIGEAIGAKVSNQGRTPVLTTKAI